MAITEIFQNPTVKQVIFQIRFPSLFYIESKIGELQLKIINDFPESALSFRKNIFLGNILPGGHGDSSPKETESQDVQKIWEFRSTDGVKLNITSDSLDISSWHHKTYNLGDGDKFRDIIESVVNSFFEVTSIPIITRIGLRYIDDCPIPDMSNDSFLTHYNSSFPLARFSLLDANEMDFKTVVKRGIHFLTYRESLRSHDDNFSLVLDFDGFSNNIKSEDCLSITDELHTIINCEFENTIKDPIYCMSSK